MLRVPVPWFWTIGDKGEQFLDKLDNIYNMFFGRQPINPNTFWSPNANVKYTPNNTSSPSNSFFGGWWWDNWWSGDSGRNRRRSRRNPDVFENTPSQNALLFEDGTSAVFACNRADPFSAEFFQIDREANVSFAYYWHGYTLGSGALAFIWVLFYLALMVAAINLYLSDEPNRCTLIITGRLAAWSNSIRQSTELLPVTTPLLAGTTVAPVEPGYFNLWNSLFGSKLVDIQLPATAPPVATAQSILVTEETAPIYTQHCSIIDPLRSNVCENAWSVPSQRQLERDPKSANYRFRGPRCKSICRIPLPTDIPAVGVKPISFGTGYCTCNN